MTSYSNLYIRNCVSKSSYDRSNVLECILALARPRAHTLSDRQSEIMLFRSCGGISRSVTHAATVTGNKRFSRVLQEVTSFVELPLSPTVSAKCLLQPGFYFELPVTGWMILTQTSSAIYLHVGLLFQSPL
jgi:hypothetical protein